MKALWRAGKTRKYAAESESLQVGLERQLCEALKMKPKLCRKLQTIGDARQWGIYLPRRPKDMG